MTSRVIGRLRDLRHLLTVGFHLRMKLPYPSLSERITLLLADGRPRTRAEILRAVRSNMHPDMVGDMLDLLTDSGAILAVHSRAAAGRPIVTYALAAPDAEREAVSA